MFSKTRLPKLIGLHLRSVRGEWVAQKICPSRIFAFADLSGPMLSGIRHQARGGPCGELTSQPAGWGAAGKRRQLLILARCGGVARFWRARARRTTAHLVERTVAADKLDWKAVLGSLRIDKIVRHIVSPTGLQSRLTNAMQHRVRLALLYFL